MVNGSDIPAWVDLLFKALAGIGGLAGIFASMGMRLARRTFATRDEIQQRFDLHAQEHEALSERLAAGEREFATIKADIAHLPDHDDIAEVKDRIGEVEGSVRALAATVEGLKEVLERVERPLNVLVTHHLKGGKD